MSSRYVTPQRTRVPATNPPPIIRPRNFAQLVPIDNNHPQEPNPALLSRTTHTIEIDRNIEAHRIWYDGFAHGTGRDIYELPAATGIVSEPHPRERRPQQHPRFFQRGGTRSPPSQ